MLQIQEKKMFNQVTQISTLKSNKQKKKKKLNSTTYNKEFCQNYLVISDRKILLLKGFFKNSFFQIQ